MRCSISVAVIAALALLFSPAVPAMAANVILAVNHNPSGSKQFATIQQAVDFAKNLLNNPLNTDTFEIVVQADPVPYPGPITPVDNVPIRGESTAGTFLTGSGSVPTISFNAVTNVTIRNFTFQTSNVGISVTNSSQISISNNVFLLGPAATAIQLQNATSTSVVNNTFFSNGTAIKTNSDITISNDIFASNSTAIATAIPLTGLSYNDFFLNTSNGVSDLGAHSIPSQAVINADPKFVDAVGHDFHLQPGSPCRNSGNPQFHNSFDNATSDMGAYGGPFADTTLLAVTGLTSSQIPPDTVFLSWTPTSDRSVTFYRVYYGASPTDLHGTQAALPAPIPVSVASTNAVVTGVNLPAPAVPAAPRLLEVTPSDRALLVTWTPVPGATGYQVFFSTETLNEAALPAPLIVNDGTATSITIPGLKNGTSYFVAVRALAQAQLFLAVTAVKDISIPSSPGSTNESPFSKVINQGVGTLQASGLSNQLSEFPEASAPFPNLKGGGCFIATAAYGFYSAPQVQALRIFRDRYLVTNAPGRALVAWYYRHGPRGAHYLNQHPWLKPPVRVLLLPLVLGAMFLVYSPPLLKTALIMIVIVIGDFLLRRKQRKLYVEMGETL